MSELGLEGFKDGQDVVCYMFIYKLQILIAVHFS